MVENAQRLNLVTVSFVDGCMTCDDMQNSDKMDGYRRKFFEMVVQFHYSRLNGLFLQID